MKPTLIIVSGFSCTGKTTLAKKIGEYYSLPVIGKGARAEITVK